MTSVVHRVVTTVVAMAFLAMGVALGGEAVDEGDSRSKQILSEFADGDPGWKVRFRSLVELAGIGPEAVPDLIDALKSDSMITREFAAQALVMYADSSVRPALEQAVKDPHPRVRMYAIRALGMLGPLEPPEQYEYLLKDNNVWGVRPMADAAMNRQDRPNPTDLRKEWAGYDLAKIDSAKLGELAPDFLLTTYSGQIFHLSQYRGKTVVVMIFPFDY